jgi:hypothetical protein
MHEGIENLAKSSTYYRSKAQYKKDLGDLSRESVERDREINGDDEDFSPFVDYNIYHNSYDHYNYG